MKIFFVCMILFFSGFVCGLNYLNPNDVTHTSQQNSNICQNCGNAIGNNNEVNAGASTSSQDNVQRCQHCELQNYVNRVVFLMLSEDKSGEEDMVYTFYTRFHEMEAFYNYILFNLRLARFGENLNDVNGEVIGNQRVQYFNNLMEEMILQLVHVACSNHYFMHLFYNYNEEFDEILVYQRHGPEANGCLCSSAEHCLWERSIITYPLKKIPFPKFIIDDVNVKVAKEILTDKEHLIIEGTTMYHIIPLAAISKFFNTWLGNDDTPQVPLASTFPPNHFNGCVDTLFKRLKRSIQKIIMVSIKKSVVYSDFPKNPLHNDNDPEFLNSVIHLTVADIIRSYSWMKGNMFIGPSRRGPLDPAFGNSPDEAFDSEVAPIIGPTRFTQLSRLFDLISNFNSEASGMLPLQRLTKGFKIYFEMTLIFTMNKLTRMNWNDWEERYLFYEELLEIIDPQVRISMQNKKYFSTRKQNKRPPRSVFQKDINVTTNEEIEFKRQWNDFTKDIMKISMEAMSRNKSLSWQCEFSRLYDKFLTPKKITHECSDCPEFSEYLYLKILKPHGWYRCHDSKDDVCVAWNNIVTVLSKRHEYDSAEYHRIGDPAWKSYLKYMHTIVMWLSSPTEIKEKKDLNKYQYHLINMPTKLMRTSAVDIALCYVWTIIPTILTWKSSCNKI